MSESLRGKMAGLMPEKIEAIKQAVADGAQEYFSSGKMNFPAESLIVSGRKSAVLRKEKGAVLTHPSNAQGSRRAAS
jgi:hypothetical protein